MRKLSCLMTGLLLCASLIMPAFAAEEEGFVPSITYKPVPEIVPVQGEDGKDYIGVICNAEGEIIDYVEAGCLRITPVAHLWDEEIEIPEDIEELLRFVYEGLIDRSVEIPYAELQAELADANMVIRDLFDARWTCEEHPKMVEPEGITLEITFDLGVMENAEIFVTTYDEETKAWTGIVKTVNNGDGTVTCTFEHLCAIAFSMGIAKDPAPVEEPTGMMGILPWIILLVIAVIAVVAILVSKKKKTVA